MKKEVILLHKSEVFPRDFVQMARDGYDMDLSLLHSHDIVKFKRWL